MGDRKVVPHRDTLWLSSADAINLFFGIVIHVILTRSLLSDEYGTFILLLDFFHVCVILVDLGLPTIIGRDGERLGSKLDIVLKKVSGIQAVIVAFSCGLFAYLGIFLFGGWIGPAILLSFAAGILVLAYAHRAAMRACGEARLEALVRISDRGIVALLMIFWAQDILQFAIATIIGPLASCVIAASVYWIKIAPQLEETDGAIPDTAEMNSRELIDAGVPFLFASAALVINVRIEKLLLGILASPEDVAIFQIAWLGFIAGYGPILSLRAILLSWFGEVRNDIEKLIHRYKLAFLYSAILCPIGVLIGLVVGPFAFEILFSDYADVVSKPFRWLLLAWLFHVIASPSLALIQTSEKPWNYTRILWGGIVVSFLLCFYLISTQTNPVDGAVKAAAISSIFVFVMATGMKNTQQKRDDVPLNVY